MRPLASALILCASCGAPARAPAATATAAPTAAPAATATAAPTAAPAATATADRATARGAPAAAAAASAPSEPAPVGRSRAFAAVVQALTPAPGEQWDPRRAWLESYREEGGQVELTVGAVDSDDAAALVRSLASSGGVRDIVLVSSERSADDTERLTVRATSVEPTRSLRLSSAAEAAPLTGAAERNPFDRTAPPKRQGRSRAVLAGSPVASLRIIAIVLGDEPRAMLTDGAQNAIVKRGFLVGPPACPYRIERIGETQVALVKTPGAACASPPAKVTLTLTR